MGKLALWGAVGGLGKGASQYGAHVLSEASKDADAKRAARLEQLRQRHRAELQGRDHENSLAQIHARGGVQAELQDDQQAHQATMQGDQQAHQVDMQGRAHKNTLGEIEARGDTQIRVGHALAPPAAAGGAGEAPAPVKLSDYVEPIRMKTSRFDGNGILQKEEEVEAYVLPKVLMTVVPVNAHMVHNGRLTGTDEEKEAAYAKAMGELNTTPEGETLSRRDQLSKRARELAATRDHDAYKDLLRAVNREFNGFLPMELVSLYSNIVE